MQTQTTSLKKQTKAKKSAPRRKRLFEQKLDEVKALVRQALVELDHDDRQYVAFKGQLMDWVDYEM